MRSILSTLAFGLLATSAAAAACAASTDASCSTSAKVAPKDAQGRAFNCGTKGYLKRPMRLNNPCQASDFGTCRDNCLDASGCLTFGYSSNGTCVMYSTSLPRMGYQQKNVEHGGRFYNRGCFERNCCSQTLDTPDNCTGMCVDKDGDRNNCGACGNACMDQETCDAGTCTPVCPAGQTTCGTDGCVDTSSDDFNCGYCGNICEYSCIRGSCTPPPCPASQTACPISGPSGCTDTSSDDNNCGRCGNACAGTDVCTNGNCSPPAPVCQAPTFADCGSPLGCTPIAFDFYNCGACGNSCRPGEVCAAGMCFR